MNIKDYNIWHRFKTLLNNENKRLFFHEREIWWCSIGMNVGFEQDGKGEDYGRPIIIIKKFNLQCFLAVPCTTNAKKGRYYFPVGAINGRESFAILSQIRLFDAKRLINKVGFLDENKFSAIKKAIREANSL